MSPIKPRWSSRSFLAYTGALTLGLAGAGWVAYLGSKTGPGVDVVWALLLFLVLAGAAEAFAGARKPVLAGVFGFTAVAAAAGVAGALVRSFGWSAARAPSTASTPRVSSSSSSGSRPRRSRCAASASR